MTFEPCTDHALHDAGAAYARAGIRPRPAIVIHFQPQEPPVVTVDQHLAIALHEAGRAGPYKVGAEHPDAAAVAVLDRGGRTVALHFNTPEDGTLGRRLAEFTARALNGLPAVAARPAAAE